MVAEYCSAIMVWPVEDTLAGRRCRVPAAAALMEGSSSARWMRYAARTFSVFRAATRRSRLLARARSRTFLSRAST